MLWSCSVVKEMSCRLATSVVCGQKVAGFFFRLHEKLKIGVSQVNKIQGYNTDKIPRLFLLQSGDSPRLETVSKLSMFDE